MSILIPGQWQSLARQKTLLNTFNNFISDIANTSLLGANNYANSNIDMDTKAKLNSDKNMTGKNNDDLCKENLITNIEKLF